MIGPFFHTMLTRRKNGALICKLDTKMMMKYQNHDENGHRFFEISLGKLKFEITDTLDQALGPNLFMRLLQVTYE